MENEKTKKTYGISVCLSKEEVSGLDSFCKIKRIPRAIMMRKMILDKLESENKQ